MKVQYVSDVHQEFKEVDIVPKLLKNIGADVLVLAGDICAISTPEDFNKFKLLLQYYGPKYKYIIHVAGNHEFYFTGNSPTTLDCMDAIHRKFKALNKLFPNYLYLNCDSVTVSINNKPYSFIGATLWTKIKKEDWNFVEGSMNDYNHIFLNRNGKVVKLTVEEMQKLHMKHRLFIKKAIEHSASMGIPTVVVTHHKSRADTPPNKITRLTQAYETDISPFYKFPVQLVIWGHTHVHFLGKENNVIYASNPKGYPSQHCGFKSDIGIEIT
jgi:predicted phosphodiesterase